MTRRPYVPFITAPALPGAHFDSVAAVRMFVHDRIAAERVCRDFQRDGDECALSVDLGALGYDADEITAVMARPRIRPGMLYMAA